MYIIYGATDKGMAREYNEDRFTGRMLTECFGYAVVCDGMGGEKGGDIASSLACEAITATLDDALRQGMDEKSVYGVIETAVDAANHTVLERARDAGDELAGMGTTTTLAVLAEDTCYLCSVGDSRAYLLHQNELRQLTVDHTHVQLMLDRGEITPEEAREHPQRHYLTKAVGVDPSLTPFFRQVTLELGDLVLLCSDGLHGMLEPQELADLLGGCTDRAALCEQLIAEANRRGGFDNITVMVIDCCGGVANG